LGNFIFIEKKNNKYKNLRVMENFNIIEKFLMKIEI